MLRMPDHLALAQGMDLETLDLEFWIYGVGNKDKGIANYRYKARGNPKYFRDDNKVKMVVSQSFELLDEEYYDEQNHFEKKKLTVKEGKNEGKDFYVLVDTETDQFVEGTFRWCK